MKNKKNTHIYGKVVAPRSNDPEAQRRQVLLNTLLFSLNVIFTALSFLFYGKLVLSYLGLSNPPEGNVFIFTAVLAIFWILFFVGKRGYNKIVSVILITLLFLASAYLVYIWGILTPQGLLLFAAVIILSGILVSYFFSLFIYIGVVLCLALVGYLQISGYYAPDLIWLQDGGSIQDIIAFGITLGIISIASWLFNRELEGALHRALESEKLLKKERDMLEVIVEKRTKKLKRAQSDQLSDLYRFSEFGKLTSSILHDLSNPLTSLVMNLESAQKKNPRAKKIQEELEKARKAARFIEDYVVSAKKQISQQDTYECFHVNEEINDVLELLNHKIKKNNIALTTNYSNDLLLACGNPIKFNQILSNIVSNACDAVDVKKSTHYISIDVEQSHEKIVIIVTDNGVGIPEKQLKNIFEPFYSTKKINGTGIGLSFTKEMIEKAFEGSISVRSDEGEFTEFTIIIPVKSKVKVKEDPLA